MSFSLIKEKHLSSFQSHSSQQDQHPWLVCTWSAHAPQSGPSTLLFPRYYHTVSATATAAGELFLFGGHMNTFSSNDLYVISTRDFSTTLLQTSGEVPSPREGHDAVLTSTDLLIWGGKPSHTYQGRPLDDSLHLLNRVSREWTCIETNGPGPGGRYYHTVTMVGSKFFVFGGQSDRDFLNDMWALDLNSLKSQPAWESYKPTPGNEKPLPRIAHVSVTTEDHIIVFGGYGYGHHYNDTWSFNISTRKWTELHCTGSIPSPRADHAAVVVGDVMYVYGGFTGKTNLNDLYALQLSTQRWFNLHNVGKSPLGRSAHAMASNGTRVFVLGGNSEGASWNENSLIHVFDTKHIKYPDLLTQEQPQHPKSSSSKAHCASHLQKATPTVSGHPATVQITHKRNPSPNGRPLKITGVNSKPSKPRRVPEGDVSRGSTECHAKFAAPHSSEGEQPPLVCRWSAHAPQSGPSKSPFPRSYHTLSATATAAGELFLFGGYKYGISKNDLYVISTRDFSTTLLQTSGEVPSPRGAHDAALTSTNLLIWGGDMSYLNQGRPLDDSLRLLNRVSRKWTRIVANGPGPRGRYDHTVTMVGSKFFVFGGRIDGNHFNDMWALDLSSLNSQPVWESYEPTPGNEKPLPRSGHVSVTTEDHIIVLGGKDNEHFYNDTWSFNISTRKWTELQCTGSVPSSRTDHAAVLVDDIMYVFGGFTGITDSDDLYALQLSTQRWFKFDNMGKSPLGRSAHAMASDGTRVFVLGGYSKGAPSDDIFLIHVFDTKHIKYPEPERNAVDPNEKATQLARKSSTAPLTQVHPKFSSSEAHGASRLQKATPAISDHPATVQIIHGRNPALNGRPLELTGVNSKPRRVLEGDVSESATGYHAKFAAPHSYSEGEAARLELERQLSTSLAAQTERDQRIAQLTDELERQLSISLATQTEWDQRMARLTDELALKSTLLVQAEANAAEASKRAGLELREHVDRLLMQTPLVKQRDAELVDMQARLGALEELLLSLGQQVGKYEKELANVRAKLEANESELEAVRSRLTDTENGWTKSKAEANTIRTRTAAGSVNRDEDPVTRRLMERVRAIEAEMASRRWNEKSLEEMGCRNEGEEYRNEG